MNVGVGIIFRLINISLRMHEVSNRKGESMTEYVTTVWENIRGRIIYLKKHDTKIGEGVEIAMALTEEIERLHIRIDELEKKLK